MKVRKDFVTNSSSTSYTCSICGYMSGGFEASPNDCGLYECFEHNHTVCKDHLDSISIDDIKQKYLEDCKERFNSAKKEMTEEFVNKLNKTTNLEDIMNLLNDTFQDDYESFQLPSSLCPVCNFSVIDNADRNNFRKILLNLTNEEVDNIIHSKFKSYNDFLKFIGNNLHKVGTLNSNLRNIVLDSNCKIVDNLLEN